ncbi:YcxB family protein [Wenyingzhuangia sp. IMCC45467]
MNINFQLTNSDFLEYQLYNSSKSPSHKKKRFKSRIIVPVIYLFFGLYLANVNDDNGIGIKFAGIGILWFVIYPTYSKWRYKKHFQKHIEENYKNRINKSVEIKFKEDFIYTKDFTSESKINSAELKEFIETKKHFFIKLTTELSLIVPKHSIESIVEFKKKLTDLGVEYKNELNWKWK